jgi:chromosomal replication initiation ATPase DnaA
MTQEPRQLTLDLPHRPALGEENFLVSASNAAAVALIDHWPDWPRGCALVVGAAQSGKTHLAHVWQYRSKAGIVSAADLDEACMSAFAARRALVVEDLHRGIGDERTLFHLLNLATEENGSLLLTSARPAGELMPALPDLRSRLRATAMVPIEPPDEALIGAVLVKLFSDRQLSVEPAVIAHAARHVDRSMAKLARLVDLVDREALALRRKVTRPLIAEILVRLASDEGSSNDEAGL